MNEVKQAAPMTDIDPPRKEAFLDRWSRVKREVEAGAVPPGTVAPAEEAPVLPSLEVLAVQGLDADFAAFMQKGVSEVTRRAAIQQLFKQPVFNVMDGLDVYIDDYNKFEPLPPELVKELAHARYLFDPPKTRINAQGHVEDVPEDEAVAEAAEPSGDAVATASETSPPPASDTASAPTGEGDAAPSPDAPHHDSNTAA